MTDKEASIWVTSEVAADQSYTLAISVGPDHQWPLDRDTAWRYCQMIASCISRASYDAAVFKMLTSLGLEMEAAAMMVIEDLRPDRRPLEEFPLTFPGGMTKEGKPFVHIMFNGESMGTWDIADIKNHFLNVVEAIEMIELDTQLLRVLTHTVGLDTHTARGAIAKLGEHLG